jgi:hypothetical protein
VLCSTKSNAIFTYYLFVQIFRTNKFLQTVATEVNDYIVFLVPSKAIILDKIEIQTVPKRLAIIRTHPDGE